MKRNAQSLRIRKTNPGLHINTRTGTVELTERSVTYLLMKTPMQVMYVVLLHHVLCTTFMLYFYPIQLNFIRGPSGYTYNYFLLDDRVTNNTNCVPNYCGSIGEALAHFGAVETIGLFFFGRLF